MQKIQSLVNLSFDSLFHAFNLAFADYEVQVNQQELRVMLNRRGFVPALSFGLFDNDRLVAFTLNGIGEYNGKMTAYDTGTQCRSVTFSQSLSGNNWMNFLKFTTR